VRAIYGDGFSEQVRSPFVNLLADRAPVLVEDNQVRGLAAVLDRSSALAALSSTGTDSRSRCQAPGDSAISAASVSDDSSSGTCTACVLLVLIGAVSACSARRPHARH
jgi:hypothetical protein